MYPTITTGDFVISSKLFFNLKPGDIVIVKHPVYSNIIKRVKEISLRGNLWLYGDNNDSITSEEMGLISDSMVKGKVIFIVKNHLNRFEGTY